MHSLAGLDVKTSGKGKAGNLMGKLTILVVVKNEHTKSVIQPTFQVCAMLMLLEYD